MNYIWQNLSITIRHKLFWIFPRLNGTQKRLKTSEAIEGICNSTIYGSLPMGRYIWYLKMHFIHIGKIPFGQTPRKIISDDTLFHIFWFLSYNISAFFDCFHIFMIIRCTLTTFSSAVPLGLYIKFSAYNVYGLEDKCAIVQCSLWHVTTHPLMIPPMITST